MQNKELFKIGEVSRLFHISVGTLRHYEKIGLIQPEYIDLETGYRYYSVSQFECLNTIRYLRALDMPLEKILTFIHNRDVNQMRQILIEQKAQVELKRQELELIERKISNRLKQLDSSLLTSLDVIMIENKPARRLAFLKTQVIPHNYLDLETSIRELEKNQTTSVTFLGKVGIGLSAESLLARKFHPYELVFIILDEEDDYQGEYINLPPETCVVIRFQGSHDMAAGYYEKLITYIKKEKLKIVGFSKEITIIDNGMTNDRSQFVTEIQIPIMNL